MSSREDQIMSIFIMSIFTWEIWPRSPKRCRKRGKRGLMQQIMRDICH